MTIPILKYIRFRLHAKHLHGIHSPFVFKLLKNAFENPEINTKAKEFRNYLLSQKKSGKRIRFLSGIESQMPEENIVVIHNDRNSGVTEILRWRHRKVLVSDLMQSKNHELLTLFKDYDIIFFIDVRCNDKVFTLWEELFNLPQVTLALDGFYDGVLFLNRPMEKQYFNIRI